MKQRQGVKVSERDEAITESKSQPKHTPGPWNTGSGPITKVYPWRGIGNGKVAIAHALHTGCVSKDECEANARLIAAAPDLLYALKIQASWTMRDGTPCACPAGKNEDEPKGNMPTVHATSCELLRAAIAKAEGR